MPDSYYPPRFWVEASNIHTGELNKFGPYEGFARLTYENLMRVSDDDGPDFLFSWVDPQDTEGENGDPNPHGYECWTGIEGDTRFFGWRKSESRPIDTPEGRRHKSTSQELVGPFYTDLVIITERQ